MATKKTPKKAVVPIEPATVVSVEPLEGSGDSVAHDYVETAEIVDQILGIAFGTRPSAAEVASSLVNRVGTDLTPVVPAPAKRMIFCDPPGVWMEA